MGQEGSGLGLKKDLALASWRFWSAQGDRHHQQTHPQTDIQWRAVMTVRRKRQGPYVRGSSRGTCFRWGGGVRFLLWRDVNKEQELAERACMLVGGRVMVQREEGL